ncbi:hypothetical protein [Cohnella yongneupensis]|uniref:VCBS repeat-containing protein n=1 Tax=Cohnella yongneupensis TaxID=425006 RepID=A0ABW0R1Z5_9BACL
MMKVHDYDGDGKDELSIVLYVGSGTGYSVEQLHMLEIGKEEAPYRDNELKETDYLDQVDQAVQFKVIPDGDKASGELTVGSEVYPVSLPDYSLSEFGSINENLVLGNIVRFSTENGTMIANFGVGYTCANFVSPVFFGNLYANVRYMDGKFSLSDFRFTEDEQ